MLTWIIYGMVFCGAALMIYNIYGFIRFALFVRGQKSWKRNNLILYIPIFLLIFFFLGYVAVGAFGKPDLITAGILFGGSIFVFIIYKLLNSITNQILESERLEAQLTAAEESNRVKTTFLSTMSHEMRTPLNVILGQDRIALMDPEISEDTRDHLNKIGLSAQHLLGLINNILDMNQIESGELVLKQEEFSMKEMLDQVNAIVESLCEENGLTYEVSYPASMHDHCIGDNVQVKHILASILDNAIKYTDAPGTVRMEVDCKGRSSEAEAGENVSGVQTMQFVISDTGIGMDSSFLSRIFQRFEKEDSSSTSQKGGSGISLAVSKHLIDLMNGTIEVESEKGKGSTFTVQIPFPYIDIETKIQKEAQAKAQNQDIETVSLAGRRILIVEDIPENAEIVADLLELEDAETEHAQNGQIAVDMFGQSEEGYYDAILMDLRMPVMDGLEATRRIRALDRDDAKKVPIIALTANAYESDVKQSLEAGMNAHMAKPTDADELYESIKKWIRA